MTDTPFQIERRGAVFEFTLSRGKANAIDAATSKLMGDAFADFRDDPEMRVAIITGAGEKFFCPGWDLKSAAEGEAPDSDYGVGGFAGLQELPNLNKPVIAAVNGICCGGGLEWALSADMIIASENASFALPEIRSGTIADAATAKLPKRIPYNIAMELLLTGRWFTPEEGKQWGLVNDVVAHDSLMEHARKLADLLASGPPLVYAAIKEVARAAETMSFQETMDSMNHRTFPTIATLYASDDQLEGARAFAEKRDPVWKGK
ncbi:MAG: carnitinyl-CoA dehydratase [Pseudomonadota bacterium]